MYQLIQSIQAYVYAQDKTIRKLQKKIDLLEKKIAELQDRPPIRVEKMEYKFDQLKVETLEGTLNIGLNPSDLQGIEDYSVPSQNGVPTPQERMALFTEIENQIHQYLDDNLQNIMRNIGEQLQLRIDDTYREFILQDIKKQLPSRIEYYLNQPPKNGSTHDQHKEWIFEQMKKEIHHGVSTFLQHLPENMKGPNKE